MEENTRGKAGRKTGLMVFLIGAAVLLLLISLAVVGWLAVKAAENKSEGYEDTNINSEDHRDKEQADEYQEDAEQAGIDRADADRADAEQAAIDQGGINQKDMDTNDEDKDHKNTGTLHIEVVDDWPPESELEVTVVEEERDAWQESDSVFVEMTNMVDSSDASVWVQQEDGEIRQMEGTAIHINTAKFFVPEGGSLGFGVPNFTTELFAEGEWKARQRLDEDDLIGDDYADFNEGIDATRALVAKGCLNQEITELLDNFPQINPHDREYTLRLVNAGVTLRQEDEASWWDVDYGLYTKLDNGEEIMLAYLEIYKSIMYEGEENVWSDAHYRMDVSVQEVWRIMEDPTEDQGEVWLQQIRGDSFADEDSIRQFVDEQGAEIVLPQGLNERITWECTRQEAFYYDFLVFQGETADYTVALAVPLMEKQDEGYYLASRIRREAVDKTACQNTLAAMMQTFRGVPYLHVVREGETLPGIAEKYCGDQEMASQIRLFDESTGSVSAATPEELKPGRKLTLPRIVRYDGRRDAVRE